MKTLLVILSSILLLSSCKKKYDRIYVDAPTKFVVKTVWTDESLKFMSVYDVEVIDMNGFGRRDGYNLSFSFTDSVGKYRAGEVITFYKD